MQNQSENRAYAGFFTRWLAYCIDLFIANLVVLTIKIPCSLAASSGVEIFSKNILFHFTLVDVIGYIGVAAFFVLITYFAHTTIGKALLHLQVVCDKEWTFINILYRETIGRFLSSIMCIGYLAAIVTKEKQGFHDMLCDTYVVYKDMYVKPKNSVVAGAVSPMTTNVAAGDNLGQSAMVDRSVSGGLYVAGEQVAEQHATEQETNNDNEQVTSVEVQAQQNENMPEKSFVQESVVFSSYVPTEQMLKNDTAEQLANDAQAEQSEPVKEMVADNENVTPQPTTGGYHYYDVSNVNANHTQEKENDF